VNSRAFVAFRVMAYATGVMLLLLVFVAMPIKYLGDNGTPVRIIGTTHGWLYIGYVISAFVMAQKLRWGVGRTVLLLLAGTIPFMSFVAERKVRHQVQAAALVQSD
jgi:integral membrane protein